MGTSTSKHSTLLSMQVGQEDIVYIEPNDPDIGDIETNPGLPLLDYSLF